MAVADSLAADYADFAIRNRWRIVTLQILSNSNLIFTRFAENGFEPRVAAVYSSRRSNARRKSQGSHIRKILATHEREL
jgi:hypothetical protein